MIVRCKWCNKEFEKEAKVSRVTCPYCGKENVYYVVV
jgi:DNA-directed RNA polymerase subunit RPC12/RpoP